MSLEVQKKENSTVSFELVVDAKTFETGMEAAYKKNVKKINIPGFRKGKAPRKLIEKMYGESAFYDDAVEEVFPEQYIKALDEANIDPIDRPSIDIKQIGSGQDLVIEVTVAVRPEAEVKEYKGLEVKKANYDVTDEDLQNEINEVLDKNARLITLEDKAIEKGNIVVIDFKGFVDGKPFEGGEAEDYELEIGSGMFIAGFEDQLVGTKADEEKEVDVVFPENYHVEALKAKPAKFDVKVKEVKEKELPVFDDEFVKDVSEFDTVDEYKADLKKHLEQNAKVRAEKENERNLLDKLVENTEVEVPEVMIDNQTEQMLRSFAYTLYMQGITLDKYMELTGLSKEQIKANFKDDAVKDIKAELALAKVEELEKITVTEEEIDSELADMAGKVNKSVEEYKESIEKSHKDYREDIKFSLLRDKTIKYLLDNSKTIE